MLRDISLLAFDDIHDFNAYRGTYGLGPRPQNGLREAIELFHAGVDAEGYQLDQDTVRAEVEIVLYLGGTNKIQKTEDWVLHVVPVLGAVPAQSAIRTATQNHLIATYTYTGGAGTLV